MKKYLLVSTLFVLILMPLAVFAQISTKSPISDVRGVTTLIERIVNWFSGIVFTISVAILLWAGVKYMISGGDPEKTGAAKKMLASALIGITIALFAYGARGLIESIFTI